MNDCCIKSFVAKGFREHFALSKEGDEHDCERCGMRYVLRLTGHVGPMQQLTWTEVTH